MMNELTITPEISPVLSGYLYLASGFFLIFIAVVVLVLYWADPVSWDALSEDLGLGNHDEDDH